MKELFTEREGQQNEAQDMNIVKDAHVATPATKKTKLSKKKKLIIGGILVVIAVIAAVILIPSEFERIETKCVHIAGEAQTGKNYFKLDTYPDHYENMDPAVVGMLAGETQENTLDAIKYANEALGFSGAVYSNMMETTALMGRQSEENDKYRVSWTYHPDDGLEVTYEKK